MDENIRPGRAVDDQAVSMAALFQALNHRFDKDRFQVHNMGVVGPRL
jgi:hypothetical protein